MDQNFANAPYEEMGPSLLAQQPANPSDEHKRGKDWDTIYSHLESRRNGLRSWRWSWWAYWNVLAEFILPRRHHWVIVANRQSKGNPINNAIIDSTATLSMQICAAGLWTGLTSPSRPWFKLGIGLPWVELQSDGKEWLEDTEQRIYTVLAQGNAYPQLAQAFQDVATFGTAPIIIYEDFEDGIRFYLPCTGEYYLAAGARFSVDTLVREFTMTISEIVEMFKLENCPADVQTMWQSGGASLDVERVVCHAIEPNAPLSVRGKKGAQIYPVPDSFVWREFYWVLGSKEDSELSRRGFHERPFVVARWSTVSNDPYGRSPGMDALGDTKQIQLETKRKAEFIEKGVRPPMGANPELKNEPSSIIPGNITYTNTENGKKGFWPLFEPNPAWLSALVKDIEVVSARIERCFFVDIFMAISRMEGVQPRNELELTKRDLERLQVLGPFINLFETEVAGPMIERILAILRRRNMLLPMPKSLQGIPLKITYTSIMKLAQRSAESVALKDVLQTAGELTEASIAAGVPSPIRVLNLDEAMREYVDLANANPKILYTKDEVAAADAAKAKAMQAKQQAGNAMAAVQAGQTLSQTPIGGGTALGALLGHGGATPINTSGGGQ